MHDSSVNNDEKLERYVRPVKELWEMWSPRVKMGIYPFNYASYDHDEWVAAFTSIAKPYEVKANKADKDGDAGEAKENYLRAFNIIGLPGILQLI